VCGAPAYRTGLHHAERPLVRFRRDRRPRLAGASRQRSTRPSLGSDHEHEQHPAARLGDSSLVEFGDQRLRGDRTEGVFDDAGDFGPVDVVVAIRVEVDAQPGREHT
jgi:hypothetical protein